MDSQFNPELFLQTSYNQETSTKSEPLEPGEYVGLIQNLNPRQVQGKQDPTKTYVFLDMEIKVNTPPEQLARVGRESSNLRYSVGVEFNESGAIDMGKGKNIGLGRLREAVGQNVSGQPWSPAMLNNQMVKVKVGQTPNPKDSSIIWNEITAVGKP